MAADREGTLHTNTLGVQSDWSWKDCCRRKCVLFSWGSERERKTAREGGREKEMKTIIVLLEALLAVVVKGGEKIFLFPSTSPSFRSFLYLSQTCTDSLAGPSVLPWGAANPDLLQKMQTTGICLHSLCVCVVRQSKFLFAGIWWGIVAELQPKYSIWPRSSHHPAGVCVSVQSVYAYLSAMWWILDITHNDVRTPSHMSSGSVLIILVVPPFTVFLPDLLFLLVCLLLSLSAFAFLFLQGNWTHRVNSVHRCVWFVCYGDIGALAPHLPTQTFNFTQ